MGAAGYAHCYCCTRTFMYSVDAFPERAPTACPVCRKRGGLCLHNAGERRELPPVRFHYGVPHEDASGAEDPSTCRWCVNRHVDIKAGGLLHQELEVG